MERPNGTDGKALGMGRGVVPPKELRRPAGGGTNPAGDPVEALIQQTNQLSVDASSAGEKSGAQAVGSSGCKGGGDLPDREPQLEGHGALRADAKSSLSPFAMEFVPRIPTRNEEYYKTGSTDIINGSKAWPSAAPVSEDDSSESSRRESELEPDDYVALNELKEFIDTISSQPGRYDSLVGHITDVLNNWMEEDVDIIMQCVVNTIVDQAIMDQNFRYNGVRLCIHLIDCLKVVTNKGSFKEILLQRCQREHARRESLAIATDGGAYLRGVTLFVGDLSTRCPEKGIIEALPELISTLLTHPTTDNLKSACMALKLCGANLDEHFKATGSPLFDKIMDRLKTFVSNQTSKHTKELVSNVVELRERGWKSVLSPMTNVYNPYAGGNSSHPGGDHESLPAQGMSFDPNYTSNYDFGPCGDEQDNDVCDAFEEFLRSSGQMQ